jgi:hypothetical protein
VHSVPSLLRSCLPIFYYFLRYLPRCSHFSLSMVSEADQTLHAANKPIADEGKNDSKTKSEALITSSSVTLAVIKMADNKGPDVHSS